MYYEREWKPEASKHEIQKAKREYEKVLKDFPLTYEELTPIALEYAKRIEPIMEGNWFSEFVTIFCKEDNEPEDERIARLCGNYLRHVVIDYDETIDDLYENFWVPVGLITDLWKAAMNVIVAKYPQIQPAYTRGLRIKEAYPDYKYDRRAEEFRIRREKEQKEEREKRQLESQYSGQVTLKPNITKLTVYHNGHYYEGDVIKVNRKTIKVHYKLKTGREFTRNVSKLVLYQSNHEKFTGSDEIDTYLTKRFGEEPSQKRGFETLI